MFFERRPGTISAWYVVFDTTAPGPIWRRLIPGYFKHVWAYGECAEAASWVLIDPAYMGMAVSVFPKSPVSLSWPCDVAVLYIKAKRTPFLGYPVLACCTSTVRHLVGLPSNWPSGIIPDRLYVDCLEAGAQIVQPCASFSHHYCWLSRLSPLLRLNSSAAVVVEEEVRQPPSSSTSPAPGAIATRD